MSQDGVVNMPISEITLQVIKLKDHGIVLSICKEIDDDTYTLDFLLSKKDCDTIIAESDILLENRSLYFSSNSAHELFRISNTNGVVTLSIFVDLYSTTAELTKEQYIGFVNVLKENSGRYKKGLDC